ncbi:SCO6745 family protein [Streptomyces sp. NPDC002867]
MDTTKNSARTLWSLIEPVHAVTYFAPESHAAFEEAGLRGFWRGYFAGRAAPLGPVGPGPVVAAFFSFAPAMVARALPSVWDLVSPADALAVRRSGARAALRRLLAGLETETARAAELLPPYARDVRVAGRPLAAANAGLPWPDDPVDRLWHCATLLREHRGDGHVAALVAAGLDGCEILALRAGIDLPRSELQPHRGWSDAQWSAACQRLADRGLLGPDGTATDAGREVHRTVETATDAAAVGAGAADELLKTLTPLSRACAGALRFPNPMGLPAAGT